jgi:hypothetical protein
VAPYVQPGISFESTGIAVAVAVAVAAAKLAYERWLG